MLYLVSCGVLSYCGCFPNDGPYEEIYKYWHEWLKFDIFHPNNCVLKYCHKYWNLDEIHSVINDNNCVKNIILGSHLVSSKTIRVGDTKHNV